MTSRRNGRGVLPITNSVPRTARCLQQGYCYHVLNRGNGRATLFFDRLDYAAFVALLDEMKKTYEVLLFSYCLMPNHFHLVMREEAIGGTSAAMHWLQTSYVSRFRAKYESTGHIFQGRFKSFPIQEDNHLLTVMRYVERNPVEAGLAARARDWKWSSARLHGRPSRLVDQSPVPLGPGWAEYVDTPQTSSELAAVRRSIIRGVPFGAPRWQHETAQTLGLSSTLRPRGRPRKG